MTDRCPGRARHWRIVWGTVGLRSPVCIFCGSPNPRPLTEQEWADLRYHAHHYEVGRLVQNAIHEHDGAVVRDCRPSGERSAPP